MACETAHAILNLSRSCLILKSHLHQESVDSETVSTEYSYHVSGIMALHCTICCKPDNGSSKLALESRHHIITVQKPANSAYVLRKFFFLTIIGSLAVLCLSPLM
jgi:hypothetical protein